MKNWTTKNRLTGSLAGQCLATGGLVDGLGSRDSTDSAFQRLLPPYEISVFANSPNGISQPDLRSCSGMTA